MVHVTVEHLQQREQLIDGLAVVRLIEAGIEAALEAYRHGRVLDAKRAREIIDAAFGR